MEQREADRILREHELVVLATGAMAYVKELVERCLGADIPAAIGRPPGRGKS